MELLQPHLGLFFWTLIAFLVVFFILGKFAWKPILESLRKREDMIEGAIKNAETLQNKVKELELQQQEMLQKAKEERNRLLQQAKDDRDLIINEAKATAKQESDRILKQANDRLQADRNQMALELKQELAEMIVVASEKVLRQKLGTKKEQQTLIESLLEDVSFKNN